jgi:DNA-binding transcriptional regulator YdaS (Cro superfamily)
VTLPDGAKPDEVKRVENFFQNMIQGVRKAFRVIGVSGETKLTTLTPDIKNLDLEKVDARTIDNIAFAFDRPIVFSIAGRMQTETTAHAALEEAVSRIGGQSALARLCDRSQATVWNWLNVAKQIPAEFVLRVEAETGISRHHLRPDIYPPDLGPSPRWHGVDGGSERVAFNRNGTLQERAA